MAETKKKSGSTKRFGARYGRRLRAQVAEIESGYKGRNACPYCTKIAVRRSAAGIWECSKCKAKFTGRAYTFRKASAIPIAQAEEVTENG